MNGEDLKPVMALLAGLWPSPPVTYEEALAWSAELTGRQKISPEEANTILAEFAESGTEVSKYRPRPGQIIPMVQALRRKRAIGRPAVGQLQAVVYADDHEHVWTQSIAECRAACEKGKSHLAALRRKRVGAN